MRDLAHSLVAAWDDVSFAAGSRRTAPRRGKRTDRALLGPPSRLCLASWVEAGWCLRVSAHHRKNLPGRTFTGSLPKQCRFPTEWLWPRCLKGVDFETAKSVSVQT